MAVPMMQYAPAVPPMQLGSFAPPMMSEVNRQVYELPPQPCQPLCIPGVQGVSSTDIELLGIDTEKLGLLPGRDFARGGVASLGSSPCISPVNASPGNASPVNGLKSPEGYRRRRSMSCASGVSGVSDASAPSFRHDPYGETEEGYVEASRTPSPRPQGSPALSFTSSAYSFTGIPPLEGSSSLTYTHSPTPTPAPFAPINAQQPPTAQVVSSSFSLPATASSTAFAPVANGGSITPLSTDVIRPAEQEEAERRKKKQKEPKKAVAAMIVKFKHGREGEYYSDVAREVGTYVIIEGQRGQDLGIVAGSKVVDNKPRAERRRRRVRRDATREEVEDWKGDLFREEQEALSIMKAQVTKHRVPIVVHRAEFQFDRKKLTFHYTTKVAKPDFRSVLHDGFRHFKCRIWMNNCDPSSCEPGDRINLNSECLPVL